jgi:hypothetical protein
MESAASNFDNGWDFLLEDQNEAPVFQGNLRLPFTLTAMGYDFFPG